jgi:hypothetical protein
MEVTAGLKILNIVNGGALPLTDNVSLTPRGNFPTAVSTGARRRISLLALFDIYCSASECRLSGELRKWAALTRNERK